MGFLGRVTLVARVPRVKVAVAAVEQVRQVPMPLRLRRRVRVVWGEMCGARSMRVAAAVDMAALGLLMRWGVTGAEVAERSWAMVYLRPSTPAAVVVAVAATTATVVPVVRAL
jgi:hypothetical protein